MPARPWPDGPAGWRRGLAGRLRALAGRIGPAGQGPPDGIGGPATPSGPVSPTPARGFDLSGAPEHWVRLLRDAGLAPAEGGPAAAGGPVPAVDGATVPGHFGLSRLRKIRLWPTTARMRSAVIEPKSPTTAPGQDTPSEGTLEQDVGSRDSGIQDMGTLAANFDAPDAVAPTLAGPALRPLAPSKDVEKAPQRIADRVPVLRLRPDRTVLSRPMQPTPAPSYTAQPTPTVSTPAQRVPARPAPALPTPVPSTATGPTTDPREARRLVRPALRLLPRPKDVEQASQRASQAPAKTSPAAEHPTRPAAVVLPKSPEPPPRKPQPTEPNAPESQLADPKPAEEPKAPHPSSAAEHTPKSPLTGTWPELAPKPNPQTTTSQSSEHLEHALARAARLSVERSAV